MGTSRPVGDGLPESGVRGCSVNWNCWRCSCRRWCNPKDSDRAEIVALWAAISRLITEITIGLADPPLSCAD